MTPEEAEAFRTQALEILRKEVPGEEKSKVEGRGASEAELEAQTEPAGAGSAHIGPSTEPAKAEPANIGPVQAQVPNFEEVQLIPARMLNEFVYCQRLFYYEFVEGVFVESADTLRGSAIHARVDSGTGAMPAAQKKSKVKVVNPTKAGIANEKASEDAGGENQSQSLATPAAAEERETIHSRSVQLGSQRLGVIAKMDLVEITNQAPIQIPRPEMQNEPSTPQTEFTSELFAAYEVCPVDYKAGAPKEGMDANELWDTDKMQLGLQALILRDNGYICKEGVIYYRATKQRVRLPIKPELETWILEQIAAARVVSRQPIPAPLVNSPKCVRCSLAPVCLPDETRMLSTDQTQDPPRRLMAARDDKRPLYLNTPGFRVGCSEEVLNVKEKDRVVEEIRMRDVSHVALFGNIQISTQAVQALCELEVPITYFSMGGWFYGITRGHELKNVFLRMEQFRLARDRSVCLSLARQMVHGKIRNQRTMIMRNHVEPPEPAILKLKRASEDALEAGSLEELLGIEGAAASMYFQQFNGMIKSEDDLPAKPVDGEANGNPATGNGERRKPTRPDFNLNFANRNRRPPTDPVNAMLGLAYSLLSKDCTLAAVAVGFDPYVGFYHQPRFGRPALALDLMEEFRPLIAESTVLNCINNRVVTEKDFVRAGEAVNLSASGRKRFFQIYEQRMSSLITHPLFDYKVSYRRVLELQARILAKTITGEIAEYAPLLTR
jgi:CRISPR-associated protein Cas1